MSTIYRYLTSLSFVPVILMLLAIASIPGTIGWEGRGYYDTPPFIALLSLLVLLITTCTLRSWKSLRFSVTLVHAGFVIVCLGGVIRGLFGFIATSNVYEGGTIDHAYRWDRGRDAPLGFALTLRKISFELYPIPLRVGVLKNGEKYRLVTTAEGKTVSFDGISLVIDRFDPEDKTLHVSMISPVGRRLPLDPSNPAVAGRGGTIYTLVPVAWQTPGVKRSWVEIVVRTPSGGEITGVAEVNDPFSVQGLSIHHVSNDIDPTGRPYAGIQFVKDPGRPLVFFGMFLAVMGGILLPFTHRRRTRLHGRS